MTIYSFIGVAVTSASAVLFESHLDPVALLGRFHEPLIAPLIALVACLGRNAEYQRRRERSLAL